MMRLPTAPAPGTPVSASLIRELIDAIRARTILRGKGYRTHETPNGTYLEIDVKAVAKAVKKIPGCFEIRAPKTRDASDPGGFDNPYFMVSGRMYAAPNLGEHESLAYYRNVIVALSVGLTGSSPSASIVTRETFADLQELADDADTSVYPLYEFGPNGEVKCDLRNIPTLVAKEWMT